MVTHDRRRGAALFIVLLFSAFLGGLAAAATRTSLSGVRAAAAFADGVRADELGRSAVDILAYRLATGDAAARRGGAVAVRLPEADVVVDYLSESARIDVNLAPVPLLAALLGAAGAEPDEARAIAGRIERFRAVAAERGNRAGAAPGGGMPGGDAQPALGGLAAIRAAVDALGSGTKPTVAPKPLAIHDLSDVAQAWGLGDALARALMPSLTVSNGTAQVDPVLAGRLVVLALVGGDERADDYLQRRRQGFVDKDAALELLPLPSREFVGFKDSAAVRAVAHVTVAHRFERRYEMVLAPPALPSAVVAPAGGGGGASPAGDRGSVPVAVSWRKLP